MGVYRLYKGGTNTYQGWNSSPNTPYNSQTIATIKDPNGADNRKEITSIPSPFARIDLVKSAYAEINQACNGKVGEALQAELNKSTIYHKMVSDSLDVGEIFFNIDKFDSTVEIISWNPQNLIQQMNIPASYGQRCYANALQTYWQADGATYNFNKTKNIYILNYKGGPRPLNIIGATSPATLFFSNANDLSYVQGIQFGRDKPFDSVLQPLYLRDPKYIEFLWWLRCAIPDFSNLFPEVCAYLTYTYTAIQDENFKDRLQQIQNQPASIPNGLDSINITSNNISNIVEVLGFQLYKKHLEPVENSDFTIRSTKQPQCKYLVLPVEPGNRYEKWKYTTDLWGSKNFAPTFDSSPIVQRKLPDDKTPQPYLTISDFLEENILSSPHKFNSTLFFDGGFEDEDVAYLLPLKPLFFQYFSVTNLVDNKMIKLEKRAGGNILVTLQIPTIKGTVEYSRLYSPATANVTKNEGHIVEGEELNDSDISIMPAVAIPQNVTPYYTFTAIVPFGRKLILDFYNDGKEVTPISTPQERNKNYKDLYKMTVYSLGSAFECIQVRTASGVGMAIPTLPHVAGSDAISFAVDLGTSNIHIEYIVNGNTHKCLPFEYTSNDNMTGLMFLPKSQTIAGKVIENGLEQVRSILSRDLIPESLNLNDAYHFPTRTVLSFAKTVNWDVQTNPLELSNMCLPFGKQMPLSYNNYATDIKWSDNADAQKQIACYIKNILLLIRNKVLTLGGDLSKTSLTWFYPTSMTPYRINLFQNQWSTEFQSIFGNTAQLNCINESLAPVSFHTQNNATAKDMLTIDIGGGTTDIAFASKGNVECVTSFRFAANTLFEDNFSKVNSANGIVDFFKPQYFELAQDMEELRSILSSFDTSPTNMANTLFTILDIPCVRKKNFAKDRIDFITKLRNDHEFKLEIIIFYAAILYHAGKIINAKNLNLPRHIAFSGNGSNILKVLATPDNYGKRQLAEFSKMIIEASAGQKYVAGNKLEILGFDSSESPKSSTCKGGLLQSGQMTTPLTVVLQSSSNLLLNGTTYKDVDNEYINKVVQETYAFFRVLNDINKQYNFADNFGVSGNAWKVLDDILISKDDIKTFVYNGIEARKEKEDTLISESFFFYPIACILQQYSLNMYNKLIE